MKSRKKEILTLLTTKKIGMTAVEVAEELAIDRSNASRYLSELHKEKKIVKSDGRPVIYSVTDQTKLEKQKKISEVSFDQLVGAQDSLKVNIQQAKAAILYPPKGLHTIIFGETGTGKSLFAECMYQFAIESNTLQTNAPFIAFNCADYAQNPQLLFGHIFGIKKGAYTGALEDSSGLLAKADQGILFLDEIHRLPPEGQEMLFTFIDKGIYRPLGESNQTFQASVQIIGATTESSTSFLTTFNRRIPMAVTLPSLEKRSLDERYEIISLFIKQEANRLNQRIEIEREAILAFMLYEAKGNIGQIKSDLKLVCAKAFLHYRTHDETSLYIRKQDLTLQIQKGLLKIKEFSDRLDRLVDSHVQYIVFEPGTKEVVWGKDITSAMDVYNEIEKKVEVLSKKELEMIDLEELIANNMDDYFQNYVTELSQHTLHKEFVSEANWKLTNQLYDIAEQKLERHYPNHVRFAFALHLQSMIKRVKEGHKIIHPDLNSIRKKMKNEFQVAMDLSLVIEETNQIELPFDEIGFISMFLAITVEKKEKIQENQVGIMVLMHGDSTATSMLKTAQELLNVEIGVAMNMPLTMEVQEMYEQVKNYVLEQHSLFNNGLLLLTDMGSLNSFGHLLSEETGIRTRAITMTSTLIVLETMRMASVGRTLEDIYQNIQLSFENVIKEQFRPLSEAQIVTKKAIIVTCFTGEGVAAKLYQRILPIIDEQKVKIIQLQFLEREAFKKHIDRLMEEYEIKAIAGTVDISYQNIPFFSVYDIFDDEKLQVLKRMVEQEIPLEKIIDSLSGSITSVESLPKLIILLQKVVDQIQKDMQITVDSGIEAGIVIHLAFLIDAILKGQDSKTFEKVFEFMQKYRMEVDIVTTNMMVVEKAYGISFSRASIAQLTQLFIENQSKLMKE